MYITRIMCMVVMSMVGNPSLLQGAEGEPLKKNMRPSVMPVIYQGMRHPLGIGASGIGSLVIALRNVPLRGAARDRSRFRYVTGGVGIACALICFAGVQQNRLYCRRESETKHSKGWYRYKDNNTECALALYPRGVDISENAIECVLYTEHYGWLRRNTEGLYKAVSRDVDWVTTALEGFIVTTAPQEQTDQIPPVICRSIYFIPFHCNKNRFLSLLSSIIKKDLSTEVSRFLLPAPVFFDLGDGMVAGSSDRHGNVRLTRRCGDTLQTTYSGNIGNIWTGYRVGVCGGIPLLVTYRDRVLNELSSDSQCKLSIWYGLQENHLEKLDDYIVGCKLHDVQCCYIRNELVQLVGYYTSDGSEKNVVLGTITLDGGDNKIAFNVAIRSHVAKFWEDDD